MDGNFYTASLVSIVKSGIKGSALSHSLSVIECDTKEVELDENQFNIVACCLHELYAKNNYSIRASILRIICELELKSETSIIEKYGFDLLIAASLRSPQPEAVTKINDERSSAFKNILIQIKGRKELSTPLARSLLSSYYNKAEPYQTFILGCLTEAISCLPDVGCSSEIVRLIIDRYSATADPYLCQVLAYCLENDIAHASGSCSIGRLLMPITSISTSKREIVDVTTKALTLLLRRWAGMIGFAVSGKIFEDFIYSLRHESFSIAQLLMNLIRPYDSHKNILDGYTGFVLKYLKQSGLYDEIKKGIYNCPAIENLNKRLSKYTSEYSNSTNRQNKGNNLVSESLNELIYNVSWPLSVTKNKTMQPELSGDPNSWDWELIHVYITMIIPINNQEANTPDKVKFYNSLIDYFSSGFLFSSQPDTEIMADSIFPLLTYILQFDWGLQLIANHTVLKNSLQLSMKNIVKYQNQYSNSPQWYQFKCITLLIKTNMEVFKMWDMQKEIIDFATKLTKPSTAKHVMSLVDIYPELDITVPIFTIFLKSPNLEISNLAIETLKEKKIQTNSLFNEVFKRLIAPYIKDAASMPDADKRMPVILSAFFEFISEDKEIIECATEDEEIHKVLTKWAPIGYANLFSSPKALSYCDAPELVKWWMEKGNKKYVKKFDIASEISFSENIKKELNANYELVMKESSVMLPAHLFGELAKHEQGIELLTPYIPTLIEQCHSSDVKVARSSFFALSHFASSPLTEKIVEENDIANVLLKIAMESSSLVLRGTLISCLTIFAQNSYFSRFLVQNSWEVIKFGERYAVVPSDPSSLTRGSGNSENTLEIDDTPIPEGHEKIGNILIGILNPLTAGVSKQEFSNNLDEMKIPEVATFAHKMISQYPYAPDSVKLIDNAMEGVPLRALTEEMYNTVTVEQLAELEARFAVIDKKGFNEPLGMKKFDIPTTTVDKLGEYKDIENCCECFLSDEDLQGKIGCTRDEFYSASEEQRQEFRKSILSSN